MKRRRVVATLLLMAGLPPAALAQADGAALYAQHCAACHQADGSGTVGLAPPLKGEHWGKLGADRGYLPMVVIWGLSGPIKLGPANFVGAMPGLGAQLDDAAVAALATHVRKLQGAPGEAPYGADEVKAQRERAGGPTQTRQRRLQLLGG